MEVAREEQRLMDLLGFDTREQLIDFLNSPETSTGNMVPPPLYELPLPDQLAEDKEKTCRFTTSFGDESRGEIDNGIANKLLAEERAKDHRQMAGSLKAGQAVCAPSLDAVYRACEGLTQQASELGFGKMAAPEDLFKIEQRILNCAPHRRAPGESQLLTRMRVARAAAQDHTLQELSEATAAMFRAEAENARKNSVEQAVDFSKQTEGLQHSPVDLMTNGCKPDAGSAQQPADSNHSKATESDAGSESAAATFKTTPKDEDLDLWQRAAKDSWVEMLGQTSKLSAPAVSGVSADERILNTDVVVAVRGTINSSESLGSKTPHKVAEMSDDALSAMCERNNSGIRAIWKFVRETVSMLGVALLGWNARRHDAIVLLTSRDTSHLSVRQTWPFLTGAGIVTAWFFSPFNAFPAIILLALSLQFGFNYLKKRPSPIFLKSALLFLVMFVPTGIVHDAFFDHPVALCADGQYSYSASRSGTCSWHHGVSRWNPMRKHWWQHGTEFDSSGTPNYKGRRRKISSRM